LQPLHLRVGQPEKIAHHHPRQFGSLNHAGRTASRKSMGPDPKIANFLRIDDEIEVPLARLTVLVGENGSGKSSILKALHWSI
ncbi:AAA family ATPase, partial [Paracoccus sp. (in: a-proteobacteria)]|uniref:AAA family ATPase n=1 Tax=Paracoccus sp. TaxID=267 RepID=UPI00272D8B02